MKIHRVAVAVATAAAVKSCLFIYRSFLISVWRIKGLISFFGKITTGNNQVWVIGFYIKEAWVFIICDGAFRRVFVENVSNDRD